MKKCPLCKKPIEWEGNEFRPFCSERCKTLDLGAWASEEYAVPSDEPPNFEETPPDLLNPDGDADRARS